MGGGWGEPGLATVKFTKINKKVLSAGGKSLFLRVTIVLVKESEICVFFKQRLSGSDL